MNAWDKVTKEDVLTVYAVEHGGGALWGPCSGAAGKSYGRWFISRQKAESESNGRPVIEGTITWSTS